HDAQKLVLVDFAVAVPIRLVDHLLELLVRHVLAELLRDALQVPERDLARLVVVEEPEGLQDLLAAVLLAHLRRHHLEELREVDRAGPVLVDVRDHLLDLLLLRLEAQRAHRHLQLLGVDGARAVRVEEVERLANLLLLLLLRRAPRVVKAWRQRSRARGSRRTPIAVGAQTVAGTRGPGRSGRGTPRRTVSSNFFDFCFFDILPVETGSYGASFV
ncbi:unnamed protein product, partial [Pelagomonas calceolata]